MISSTSLPIDIAQEGGCWRIAFQAMASPCEILIRVSSASEAESAASLAFDEAIRIEQTYSRYRIDNIVHRINSSNGARVALDEETSRLLSHADACHKLSEGLFDITSGVLRKAWRFEGENFVPDKEGIKRLLRCVGWSKVQCTTKEITLLPGMEIDLGGIGKEYAVDRVAQLLRESYPQSDFLVNFGGDIRAVGKISSTPWQIGIENPRVAHTTVGEISISNGAVATSGLSHRYCLVHGKRLGHILNPLTGWPVEHAPMSVTVIGEFCAEAGLLATLAMLHGKDAEMFLSSNSTRFHCVR